jgi:L-iditol 2-dehydrogenase
VEEPQIPPGGFVKVRVRVAGICGTDLRHWKKHEPELECNIIGHELAGEVLAVGDGSPMYSRVTGWWSKP